MTSLLVVKYALNKETFLTRQRNSNPTKNRLQIAHQDSMKCRICNGDKAIIPIFNDYSEVNLAKEIYNFSGVTIKRDDNFSKCMCQSCLSLLKNCISFKKLCRRTNRAFNKSLNTTHEKLNKNTQRKSPPQKETENKTESNPSWDELVYTVYTQDDSNGNEDNASDNAYSSPISPDHSNTETCSWCLREFTKEAMYKNHELDCYKEYSKKLKEKRPPRKVTQLYLCDICGKTTKSKPTLIEHMTTHNNIFPFKCDICPYRGRTKCLLKTHIRSHMSESERPYKCTLCPKATTTSSNLMTHMRRRHGTGEKTVTCLSCKKSFKSDMDLRRHVLNVHEHQFSVQCDICFETMNRKNLKKHRLRIHNVDTKKQPFPNRKASYIQQEEQSKGTTCK